MRNKPRARRNDPNRIRVGLAVAHGGTRAVQRGLGFMPLRPRPLAGLIAAIDQHVADAGCAHFAEGDLLLIGRYVC